MARKTLKQINEADAVTNQTTWRRAASSVESMAETQGSGARMLSNNDDFMFSQTAKTRILGELDRGVARADDMKATLMKMKAWAQNRPIENE